MKFKVKEAYLLILIVLGLVSLSVYSTYALFTKEVTIDNVVSFNATLSLSDSNLVEYELVTLNPNETKIIELRVSNSSTSTLYYGCWYETLSTNPDITIGMYLEKSNVPSTGTIATTETKTLVVGIVNNSTSTTLVNLGVVGSTTSSLGLSSSRIIIIDTYVPEVLVTDEVLAANTTTTTENVNLEYTNPRKYEITLYPGTYLLETWGAEGNGTSWIGGIVSGGLGGYSKGTLTLNHNTNLFVYVGGKNGFNGPGGGASDIRINKDSYYARVIVAGGGGNGLIISSYNEEKDKYYNHPVYGGYGGGTTGGGGDRYDEGDDDIYEEENGGTQTQPGTNAGFGYGVDAANERGAGGGGWYGGGAVHSSSGSGGSGYVFTTDTASLYPTGCLLNSSHFLINTETLAGNTSFTDFDGTTVTGHSGDGSVRITGTSRVSNFSIPVIVGIDAITTPINEVVSLIDNITYTCEANSTSCTYVGPDIADTSTLEVGTYEVNYKIKSSNDTTYVYKRIVNITPNSKIDNSGANYPILTKGLIPVVYNGSNWVKADVTSSTSTYGWYDYDQKKWANAVLVSSANRTTYQNANAGTTIAEADILAFYVWIPRYKYKVWNINKVIGTQSYNAQNTGIDIVFESGTSSTGTISCTYDYPASQSSSKRPSETCTGSNGEYYTHPAFTMENQELTGFWMGKFELSSETPSASSGGENSTTLTPRILPNVTAWRSNTVDNFWKVIYDMQKESNIYGLPTLRTNTDSHMITNMEWGAVAYLTNSKYGRCTNESCTEVTKIIVVHIKQE